MQKSDDIKKELESISPKLAEIPRKDGFNIQDDYFTSLSDNVQKHIQNQQMPSNVKRGYIFGPSTIKWAAACIAILILGSWYYYSAWKSFDHNNNLRTEAYVIENFDEGIIADYLIEIPAKTHKNKEVIENSLENIDEELIIEKL